MAKIPKQLPVLGFFYVIPLIFLNCRSGHFEGRRGMFIFFK